MCIDEFQASSKELEDELEKELSATEKQQAELKEKIKRLEAEKDEWKVSQTLANAAVHRLVANSGTGKAHCAAKDAQLVHIRYASKLIHSYGP